MSIATNLIVVLSVYAPNDCSSPGEKEFYGDLSELFQNMRSADLMSFADNFNAQISYLTEAERYIRSLFFPT